MRKQEDPKKQTIHLKTNQKIETKNKEITFLPFKTDCPTDIGWQV